MIQTKEKSIYKLRWQDLPQEEKDNFIYTTSGLMVMTGMDAAHVWDAYRRKQIQNTLVLSNKKTLVVNGPFIIPFTHPEIVNDIFKKELEKLTLEGEYSHTFKNEEFKEEYDDDPEKYIKSKLITLFNVKVFLYSIFTKENAVKVTVKCYS